MQSLQSLAELVAKADKARACGRALCCTTESRCVFSLWQLRPTPVPSLPKKPKATQSHPKPLKTIKPQVLIYVHMSAPDTCVSACKCYCGFEESHACDPPPFSRNALHRLHLIRQEKLLANVAKVCLLPLTSALFQLSPATCFVVRVSTTCLLVILSFIGTLR